MITFKRYDGILFVGDPHVSFIRKGKRTDNHLGMTILNKIMQAVTIANERNLYLIFLGDLFDLKHEQNFEMVTKLIRILKLLKYPPATVEGNHEKTQATLSDDVALMCMVEAESIFTIGKNKIWANFIINGENFYVGGTPYGSKIPEKVKLPSTLKPGKIIWLSHESLDFGKTFPGIAEVKEIEGVSMLVNGHIHNTLPSKTLGDMVAHNPGNITRQTVDARHHVPSVWQWKPEQGFELEQIKLVFESDVFNMQGYHVNAVEPEHIIPDTIDIQSASAFVESMEMLQNNEPSQTNDGSYMKDAIRSFSLATNVPKEFTDKMLNFLDKATIDKLIKQ